MFKKNFLILMTFAISGLIFNFANAQDCTAVVESEIVKENIPELVEDFDLDQDSGLDDFDLSEFESALSELDNKFGQGTQSIEIVKKQDGLSKFTKLKEGMLQLYFLLSEPDLTVKDKYELLSGVLKGHLKENTKSYILATSSFATVGLSCLAYKLYFQKNS